MGGRPFKLGRKNGAKQKDSQYMVQLPGLFCNTKLAFLSFVKMGFNLPAYASQRVHEPHLVSLSGA